MENDLGLEVSADVGKSKPKRSINLRSGPKQVSQLPKKKIAPPPKQSSNQAQVRDKIRVI